METAMGARHAFWTLIIFGSLVIDVFAMMMLTRGYNKQYSRSLLAFALVWATETLTLYLILAIRSWFLGLSVTGGIWAVLSSALRMQGIISLAVALVALYVMNRRRYHRG